MEKPTADYTECSVCDVAMDGVGGEGVDVAKVRCDDGDVNKFASGDTLHEDDEELEEWLGQLELNDRSMRGGVVAVGGASGSVDMKPDSAVGGQLGVGVPDLVQDSPASHCPCKECHCETLHGPDSSSSICAAAAVYNHARQKGERAEFTSVTDASMSCDTPKSSGGPIYEWVKEARKAAGMPLGAPRRPTKGEILEFFVRHHCKCKAGMYWELEGWCHYCTSGLRRRVRDELWELAEEKEKEERGTKGVRKTLFVDGVEVDGPWPEAME